MEGEKKERFFGRHSLKHLISTINNTEEIAWLIFEDILIKEYFSNFATALKYAYRIFSEN